MTQTPDRAKRRTNPFENSKPAEATPPLRYGHLTAEDFERINKTILKDRQSALDSLVGAGIATPDGRLTKRYDG